MEDKKITLNVSEKFVQIVKNVMFSAIISVIIVSPIVVLIATIPFSYRNDKTAGVYIREDNFFEYLINDDWLWKVGCLGSFCLFLIIFFYKTFKVKVKKNRKS